jgi:hypothetical protein
LPTETLPGGRLPEESLEAQPASSSSATPAVTARRQVTTEA